MKAPSLACRQGWPRRRAVATVILATAFWTVSGCGSDDSDRLVGQWEPSNVPSADLPPEFAPDSAAVTFDRDGAWKASDGCNELVGEYTLDDDGSFTSDAGSVAGIGCSGGQVPYDLLLSQADRVTFQSDGSAIFESSDDKPLLTLTPAS